MDRKLLQRSYNTNNYMYCLTCKKLTKTSNIKQFMSKNNRPMRSGVCLACGRLKTKFTKGEEKKTLKKAKRTEININKDKNDQSNLLPTVTETNFCYPTSFKEYDPNELCIDDIDEKCDPEKLKKEKIDIKSQTSFNPNLLNEVRNSDFQLDAKKYEYEKEVNEMDATYPLTNLKKLTADQYIYLKRYAEEVELWDDHNENVNEANVFNDFFKNDYFTNHANFSDDNISFTMPPALPALTYRNYSAKIDNVVSCEKDQLESISKAGDSNAFNSNHVELKDATENIIIDYLPTNTSEHYFSENIPRKSRSYSKSGAQEKYPKISKSKKKSSKKTFQHKPKSKKALSNCNHSSNLSPVKRHSFISSRKSVSSTKWAISISPYRCMPKSHSNIYTRPRIRNSREQLNFHTQYNSKLFRNNSFISPLPDNFYDFQNLENKTVEL